MDKSEVPSEPEYDVIFAGGGTAACVTAGRLSRRFPDLKILIIERGRDSLGEPTVEHPALFMAHLMPDSTTALVCDVEVMVYSKANSLNTRSSIVPKLQRMQEAEKW